ncbi:MAG TPA: T9SS type A sorting domain-containing protein [Tenuifilaceae bacterium]|nr:T9SS type A sorting domain-containing protein [Tenuifilaceae bacterium]
MPAIETTDTQTLRVYPNPFSSSVTFEHRLPNGEGLLSIYSITGSTIFTGKLSGAQTPFDLSYLPQGAYIYTIITGGHPVYQGVVVKQ